MVMKKVLSFILVAMMVLSLTACGSKTVTETPTTSGSQSQTDATTDQSSEIPEQTADNPITSESSINGVATELPDGYSLAEEYCVGNGATEFVGRDADGKIIFDIGYTHGAAKDLGFETIEEVKAALSAIFEEMSADSSYETMTVGNYEGCSVNNNGYAGLSDMANIALVSYENDEVTLYNILYDIDSKSIIDSFIQGLK